MIGTHELVLHLLAAVEAGLPTALADETDFGINRGNVAVMVVAEDGTTWGRHFGTDKARLRETSITAWKKALQVWITGVATGEYEELVWSGSLDWAAYGIMKPDFIGWEGGIPIRLPNGEKLALGLSGFRGETDAALLRNAAATIA